MTHQPFQGAFPVDIPEIIYETVLRQRSTISLCFGKSTDLRVLGPTSQSLNTAVWTEQATYSTSLGLSFLVCTIKESSIIAWPFPILTAYNPLFSIIYLLQSYDRITGDKKKKNWAWLFGKRGLLSLFASKILVVFINLIFLNAGTCFSSLPFPSLLATSVCNRLLPHTSSFLFDQPDHLARFL